MTLRRSGSRAKRQNCSHAHISRIPSVGKLLTNRLNEYDARCDVGVGCNHESNNGVAMRLFVVLFQAYESGITFHRHLHCTKGAFDLAFERAVVTENRLSLREGVSAIQYQVPT